MSHTKGKLHYQADSDAYTHIIRDSEGRYITSGPQGSDGTDEANARRLVACWNALDGVPTEWLETYVASGAKNVIQENAALKDDADKAWKAAMTLADGIRSLTEQNVALKEALKPFAAYADHYPKDRKYGNRPGTGEWHSVESGGLVRAQIDVEDFHRAADALNKVKS